MRGMNSVSADLVYLDPPFNSKANYAAPIGSEAAGAEFKDTWSLNDVDIVWLDLIEAKHPKLWRVIHAAMTDSDKSYLAYMAVRLLELRRILKPTGSIYLHCDSTMGAYLKLLMDAIFGRQNCRTQIVWKRSSAHSDGRQGRRQHGRIQDVILFYTAGREWTWNPQFVPYSDDYVARAYRHVEEGTGRRYTLGDITGPGGAAKGCPKYEVMGVTRHWRYSEAEMLRLMHEGRIVQARPGAVPRYKRYLDEMPGVPIQDIWTDIAPVQGQSRERVGYPTQKPLALLRRILSSSSNAGDVVLDPFCGCATACVAAEELGRKWVGIDISAKAAELVQMRMRDELGLFYDVVHRTDIPKRADLGKLPPYRSHAKALYGEQGGACNGCKTHFKPQNLTVDHIIPRSKGGGDHIGNLQLLCGHCNSVKGDRGMEYLVAKLAE
ncbi:MAG: site-specific DNA-methyltransferase [Boseongicola sp. SB0667_bin_21]|nr:site-specific DNA-methyltransferase [Boseongicola sp. SB0667_bin_21]